MNFIILRTPTEKVHPPNRRIDRTRSENSFSIRSDVTAWSPKTRTINYGFSGLKAHSIEPTDDGGRFDGPEADTATKGGVNFPTFPNAVSQNKPSFFSRF